jgi:hypothetical protein
MIRHLAAIALIGLLGVHTGNGHCLGKKPDEKPAPRALPYRELTGRAEDFRFVRAWRQRYWREDFTFVLRTEDGKLIRIISREPTPWTDLRLGTTFTGLKVDWPSKPRVRVVGVLGIDRSPEEFPGLKLDKASTVTAFLLSVEVVADGKKTFRDYYVNNWFHRWGSDADTKVLAHYAGKDDPYTVYGYLGSNLAPLDRDGQAVVARHRDDYPGMIYHARVVKADNPVGYELKLIHLMGRNRKTAEYRVFHGDAKTLIKLDARAPKQSR